MITRSPASASSAATTEPPAPEPTTTTSQLSSKPRGRSRPCTIGSADAISLLNERPQHDTAGGGARAIEAGGGQLVALFEGRDAEGDLEGHPAACRAGRSGGSRAPPGSARRRSSGRRLIRRGAPITASGSHSISSASTATPRRRSALLWPTARSKAPTARSQTAGEAGTSSPCASSSASSASVREITTRRARGESPLAGLSRRSPAEAGCGMGGRG